MTRIHPFHPHLLPLKNIQWDSLICLIGDAREALGRFDEGLRKEKNAASILEPLYWKEVLSSLHSRHIPSDYLDACFYHLARQTPNDRKHFFQQVLATKKGLETAISLKRSTKIGASTCGHLHQIIRKHGPPSRDIGKIRNRQNWIGEIGCKMEDAYFYPPPAADIHPLMRNLSSFLSQKKVEPIVQIAIAFAQFLIIHPFMDGNGRVGRVLIPSLAQRKNLLSQPALFMSEYLEHERSEYFQRLFQISENNQWEAWIAFFLKGVISQTSLTQKRFRSSQKIFHQLAKMSDEKTARSIFSHPFLKKDEIQKKHLKKCFFSSYNDEYFALNRI